MLQAQKGKENGWDFRVCVWESRGPPAHGPVAPCRTSIKRDFYPYFLLSKGRSSVLGVETFLLVLLCQKMLAKRPSVGTTKGVFVLEHREYRAQLVDTLFIYIVTSNVFVVTPFQ